MTISIVLLAVGLAGLIYAAITAPLGYEDSTGFHYGEPDE